jgi:hypothetical protein
MGLLDDGQEYLRRSGRNITGLLDWLGGGAEAGAEPLMALMRGDALDEPFLPTADSGGRIGAIASVATNHALPGTMPKGSLGTYGGIASKTANRQMLGKAKAAIKRGMTPDEARQKFGWFQDPAGDWKYEISDHRAQLATDETGRYHLDHPELRRAYPDLIDSLKIDEMPGTDGLGRPNPTVADYTPSTNTARINPSQVKDREAALRALMHEIQHGVQDRERFSPGTSQGSSEIGHTVGTEYWPRYEQIENDIALSRRFRESVMNHNPGMTLEDFNVRHPDWAGKHDALLADRRNLPDISQWTFDKYNSALGEVEARDTMNRLRLTPDQRKAAPPYRGENIPFHQMWDVRSVTRQLPRAADDPQSFQGLLNRTLGASPEAKGTLLSLLGIPFLPSDTQ